MSDSKLLKFLNRNSGSLLAGLSITSFTVALWRMYVSSPEIHAIVEDTKEDIHESKTKEGCKRAVKRGIKDIFLEAWPIAASFAIGATAQIMNVHKSNSEINKWTYAFLAKESWNRRYMNEVRKEVGENKEREIRDRTIESYKDTRSFQDGVKNLTVTDEDWIIFDTVSEQYIASNKSKVLMALAKINNRNMSEHFIEYVDFLYDIGGDISKIPRGLEVKGWGIDDGVIEPVWTTDEMEGSGRPIGILSFSVEPRDPYKSEHDY